MKLIFPNRFYEPKNHYVNPRIPKDGPLFFLAGPILGGGCWQETACRLLEEKLKEPFVVACPYNFGPSNPLYYKEVPGETNVFSGQLAWESHYLSYAATRGCILFWLGKESAEEPRADGRPYAMMTRDELASWRTRMSFRPDIRLVLGGEEGFPGLPEIAWYNEDILGYDVLPIIPTLSETVDAAIKRAYE